MGKYEGDGAPSKLGGVIQQQDNTYVLTADEEVSRILMQHKSDQVNGFTDEEIHAGGISLADQLLGGNLGDHDAFDGGVEGSYKVELYHGSKRLASIKYTSADNKSWHGLKYHLKKGTYYYKVTKLTKKSTGIIALECTSY